jgi:hypothetical protein
VVPWQSKLFKKHCDFSTYLAKSVRAQSGACAEVQFPVNGTLLWFSGIRNGSNKHCHFNKYLAKRARAQSGACAEVYFPDYGTVMWAPGSRNDSRKALRFQQLSYQECQSSLWRMRRGAVSCFLEQSCIPLAVEMVLGKHCNVSTELPKRARAQSGACAEVQFPDYGTVLWSPGRRKCSITAL